MMASNPDYCLSLSEWEQKFQQWVKAPTEKSVLFCNIFFDFKGVYGDKSLEQQLRQTVFKLLRNDDKFFAYLASDALKNPPPLSFFKQFIVEDDGAHKDEFDIKARAIMPLVDASRVLTLSKEIVGVNQTVERFNKLAELEPQNAELYKSCIRSFYELLKYRSQSGFAQNNSGRFVNLKTLSKHDKNKLKYLFKPIKTIQTNLKTRFNLTYFR
jgi:CBS domain-containing protein